MKAIYKTIILLVLNFTAFSLSATCNWKARILQFSVTQNCNNTFKTLNGSVFLANTNGITYYWSVLGSATNWANSQSTYVYYPASNGTYLVQLKLTDANNNCDTTISQQINFNCLPVCNWGAIPVFADFVDSCRSYGNYIKDNSINCNLATNGGTYGKFASKWYINDTLKKMGGYNYSFIVPKNGAYKMCVDIIDTINNCDTTICHTFNVTCVSTCNWSSKKLYLYANDSCIQNQKKYFVKGAVLMNGTPDLGYGYQWYLNNVATGANYYSNSSRVYSKSNYQICVKISDPVKLCDTTICKTVNADCVNCNAFLPQISNIVLSDSCYYLGTTPFRGVVGKLVFKNPAAANFYLVKWTVDSTLSSTTTYMRQAVNSKGFKRVCLTISDTLNGCDTQICRTVYVGCSFGSAIESSTITNLKVYPNPASVQLNVPDMAGDYTYDCIDVTGKLVLSGDKSAGEAIDIASLKDGIYCLRIRAANRYYMARFVKQVD